MGVDVRDESNERMEVESAHGYVVEYMIVGYGYVCTLRKKHAGNHAGKGSALKDREFHVVDRSDAHM